MNPTLFISGIAAAAGVFFGFANPVFYFPPFIFLYLIVVNRVLLVSEGVKQASSRVFFPAVCGCLAGLYWVVVPVHYYGHLQWFLAVPAAVLLAMYVAVFTSVYAAFVRWMRDGLSPVWLGIFAGSVWAGLEYLRQWLFGGFPWLNMGGAFAGWPESVQAAGWVGEVGLSASAACLALWLSLPKRGTITAAVALVLVLLIPGLFRDDPSSLKEVSLLLVQGNVDQSKKWSDEYKLDTLEKYKSLTSSGLETGDFDLVIWPETAMPFYVQEVNDYSSNLRGFVRKNDLSLVLGAPGYEMLDSGEDYQLFNRAFFFNSEGEIEDAYDKMRLVPFGEYVPLKNIFPFLDKLVHGAKDFSPGGAPRPLQTDSLALGMLICYEIIYSGQVQDEVEAGANLLVNLSNDAWFGRTSAPRQHLHMAVMRAVEQGRYLARATNTGISAFISPAGRILEESGLFQAGFLHAEVSASDSRTFFSRHYSAVHCFWFTAAALLLLYGLLRGKRQKRDFSAVSSRG